ncbi:MAG: hypothetical protein HY867_15855 [Chloroflexi bacterium]|nr:hypothetical protein [Chloroflexota bacterium]
MNSRPPRYETILYILALLLALGLRFVRLGELPLTDSEARLALDALHIVKGQHPALSSHVAYTNLTAILFFIFQSSNFLARLIPALFGAAIVAVPFLFRDLIKPRPAAILAFLFAIDPAFVALSRQAGSPILAVTCFLLAAGFWFRRQSVPAGVFLALALLSGPSLWAGLLGLLLAWMLTQFMATRPAPMEDGQVDTYTGTQFSSETESPNSQLLSLTARYETRNTQYVPLLTAFLVTLLAASTLLLLSPQGLGAWLASLPEYLKGWVAPVTVPASRLFLALGVYQLFGLLFALAAVARGWWNMGRRLIRLSLWMLVALLLAAFYPAHQTADLVWALVPIWTLAALELSRHLELVHDEDRLEIIGVFVFTIILLTLAWMSLNTLANNPPPSPVAPRYLLSFWGSLILLILSLVLVAFGWSTRIARVGAVWGIAIMLGLYTLGAAWGGTGLRRDAKTVDLWDSSPRPAQADLLLRTLNETSKLATGHADSLAVTVQGLDSPSLLWSLRAYSPIVVPALDPASAPDVVITPLRDDLGLAAAYRGQDFAWRASPIWDAFLSSYLRWLTYRELPSTNETIILWVRNDLFVDSEQ